MPEIRVTDEQGTVHVFPDGSTPEMISKAMNLKPPSTEAVSFWSNPKEYLTQRAAGLRKEAQHQVDQNVGVEGSEAQRNAHGVVDNALTVAKRLGHGMLAVVPETAALVDSAAAGLMDWKNAAVTAAGAVDPAIPAAYFGTQGIADLTGIGGGKSSVKTAIENPTPENVQAPLVSASMVAGGAGATKAPTAGRAFEAAKNAPNVGRGTMAARMSEQVEPGGPTRQEVLDAAREKGVNLDVAQATDSGVAHAVKKANRYSIASQGTYDAATTKNVNALEQWADSEASKYSPEGGGREIVGPKMQEALKNDLVRKKAASTDLFDKLDQKVGGAPQDVSNTIAAEAQKIIGENAEYYAKHPELKPGKAWAILEDLASKTPGKAVAKAVGGSEVIDAGGNPIMQKGPAGGPKMATWSGTASASLGLDGLLPQQSRHRKGALGGVDSADGEQG
jgi:hypothetical protein